MEMKEHQGSLKSDGTPVQETLVVLKTALQESQNGFGEQVLFLLRMINISSKCRLH